jgi:hypothetical protein
MRSRFRTHPRLDRRIVVALVAAVVAIALTGCGTGSAAIAFSTPDRPVRGPQGNVGQFTVDCGFDHDAPDDPIVHPGLAGMSHLHQFFGAVGVRADSSYGELVAGDTTCRQQADTASYWAPALLDPEGRPIAPVRSVAYYRAGIAVDPVSVVEYPPGLMLVGGDSTAENEQSTSVVAWSCGTGSVRAARPPDCTGAESLRFLVTYPDCWNGIDLTSADFSDPAERHAVYSSAGACPDTHPIHIPQLQFAIDYPPQPAATLDQLRLSSGDIITGHADFWNAWDQSKLQNEVAHCIRRDLVCNISG